MAFFHKLESTNFKELSLARVLRCGQAFRWKNINGVWSCSLKGRVIFLKQEPGEISVSSIFPEDRREGTDDTVEVITDYLNLKVKLQNLYHDWSEKDKNFKKHSVEFGGIRILRQDPWENLISFICSTNNNVKRISQMCENLCVNFGTYICTHENQKYYTFPTPESLSRGSVEQKLRDLSFGYRAKYIQRTAKMIVDDEQGLLNLNMLRQSAYKEAHSSLLKFIGVGPKVADCVCLMSLDKHDVVPVDTHVWTIAQRDYRFKSGKVLNAKIYQETGDFFRELWGEYAGWAHSVLFAADLGDLNNGINLKSEKRNAHEEEKENILPSKRTKKLAIKREPAQGALPKLESGNDDSI